MGMDMASFFWSEQGWDMVVVPFSFHLYDVMESGIVFPSDFHLLNFCFFSQVIPLIDFYFHFLTNDHAYITFGAQNK